tara:strand:+ start:415 stop:858 length:444 start_codon:yes stop_codon:yes gene_type:complete
MASNDVDGMVTLTERMVHLIGQLGMPIVEVAIVLQRRITSMLEPLEAWAEQQGHDLDERVSMPWPLDEEAGSEAHSAFTLDRLLNHVDADRMDILDTLIRVTLQEVDADLIHGLLALRPWEHLVRSQLAAADGPGRLFSPLEIPDDF